MSERELHPSIAEFKVFVQKHPHLIQEVRSGHSTWQELFEEWYLLGEDDPRWKNSSTVKNSVKSMKTKQEKVENDKDDNDEQNNKQFNINQILDYLKRMDINQIQQHIKSLYEALGTAQEILAQFQNRSEEGSYESKQNPFSFRKD